METLNTVLPIIIDVLLVVLLTAGIILIIKCINIINKAKKVVEEAQEKLNSFNGFFSTINFIGDKVSSATEKAFGFFENLINKKIMKKTKTKEEEELEAILEKERKK